MEASPFYQNYGRSPIDYIRHAYQIAQHWSEDKSTQNGAIIVDHTGLVVSGAANHYPSIKVEERPAKYAFVEHAERAAIFRAAKFGIRTSGMRMFCPWAACADCARAILLAGIDQLYVHDLALHNERPEWRESVEQGNKILKGHVDVFRIPGYLGMEILFGGKLVMI